MNTIVKIITMIGRKRRIMESNGSPFFSAV